MQITLLTFDTFLKITEIIGLLAFAISGLIAALRKNLDPVGICIVTGVTAFGGGTLRDILLDRRPFFWVENSYWLWIILGLTLLGTVAIKNKHIEFTERAIQVPDAVGLSSSVILGTQIALQFNMPAIVSILMGVVSAVFGGVLRDIVCSQIPKAFSDHRPYAVLAFLGSAFYILMHQNGINPLLAFLIAFIFTVGLRLMALFRGCNLPRLG